MEEESRGWKKTQMARGALHVCYERTGEAVIASWPESSSVFEWDELRCQKVRWWSMCVFPILTPTHQSPTLLLDSLTSTHHISTHCTANPRSFIDPWPPPVTLQLHSPASTSIQAASLYKTCPRSRQVCREPVQHADRSRAFPCARLFYLRSACRTPTYALLKMILHDWSNEHAARVHKNLVPAMAPGQSRLLHRRDRGAA